MTYIEVEYKGKKYRAYPKSSMVYYPVARLTSQNFWRLMEAHGPIYHAVLKLAKERKDNGITDSSPTRDDSRCTRA